jgi:hypothetical protein
VRLILAFIFLVSTAAAQQISPPLASYSQTKVSDSFEIKNVSETQPLTVVSLTAKTFTIDSNGDPTFVDIDPSKISLKLSEQSARIPPLGTHEFFVEAKCLQSKTPCWYTIYVSLAMGRTADGVAVTVMLPHTTYLYANSIKRSDVDITWIDNKTFKLTNTGNGLDRPYVEMWTTDGKKTIGAPLLPSQSRQFVSEAPIQKIKIHFTKFTADAKP